MVWVMVDVAPSRQWASEQLELLVTHSRDPLSIIGADRTILYSSPARASLLGLDSEDAIGRDVLSYLHPDDRGEAEQRIDEAVARPGATVPFRVRIGTASGDWRWFECLGTSLIDDPRVGGIVVNSRDVTDQVENLERLDRMLRSTIDAISGMALLRDPYTAGHQTRVAALAAGVARAMQLSEFDVEGIDVAASLHDVGKLAVPSEILSAPRRLSTPEYELVKQHPIVGHDLLQTIEFPWPVATMVLQHHERVDGSGYPDGLAGSDTLLGARIIAVSDVVEAMTSHRPYRPGLGLDAAVAEIRANRGRTYDADVVDACIGVLERET